jgi:hypothetical protein
MLNFSELQQKAGSYFKTIIKFYIKYPLPSDKNEG